MAECSKTKCDKSKCLISVAAVFAFMFLYDWFVQSILLADSYAATASIWRPKAEMESMMWLCFVIHLSLAFLFSALYKKTICSCGPDCQCCKTSCSSNGCTKSNTITQGICFGTIIGLILAVTNSFAYIYLPMPASLAVSWFVASLLQGVGVGIILSLLNSKKSCGTKE